MAFLGNVSAGIVRRFPAAPEAGGFIRACYQSGTKRASRDGPCQSPILPRRSRVLCPRIAGEFVRFRKRRDAARYYWLLLAEGASDAAALWRHAAEDRNTAVASGMRLAQRGRF